MAHTDTFQGGLFTQLEPLLVHRAVLVTVSKIEGDRPRNRLRIVVTDERGRHQRLSELYPRGQIVRTPIKATGAPGSIRIEVYENGQLVTDQQY